MAAPAQCVSKVELRLECKDLLNKDVTSKSDPCAVVYMQQTGGNLIELGRTENIQNSLDPKFVHCFEIDYFFEEVQKIRIAVYDVDNKTYQLEDDDFLGQHECTLGQVVASSPYIKPLVLKNGKPAGKGTLIIRAEEQKSSSEQVYFTFQAKKLENKDFLGKSDPYLEICKSMSDGTWQTIHRTEVIKNNLNPSWRPFKLPVGSLCSGDKDKQLKLEVYDWDSDGSHDLIGGFTTTLNSMLQAGTQELTFPCINEKKKAKKKSYTDSGKVILTSCKVVNEPSFLDFIFGGMQINFTVGVDFTASNGNPGDPKSLHYMNPYQPNEYIQAIQAVGGVCQDYDTDKMFPALGFGAQIPPNNKVSHEFALNFNPTNPYCAGVQGIIDAYQNCIKQIRLYGPTNISPIIYHMAQFAAAAQNEEPTKGASAYFVLLLLTDGIITDMDETRRAIVHASSLPMSLIIIGVGDADFSAMEFLDGDEGVLKAPNGQPVVRDIVQFVPFRQFKSCSAAVLAKNVLAEVPKQVTEYFQMKRILPKPKPQQPQ